jgi:hypothetical protein
MDIFNYSLLNIKTEVAVIEDVQIDFVARNLLDGQLTMVLPINLEKVQLVYGWIARWMGSFWNRICTLMTG